jgi:hypothetical protein
MVGLIPNVMAQIGKDKPITFRDLGEYARLLIARQKVYSFSMTNM